MQRPDMTIFVDWDKKHQFKQANKITHTHMSLFGRVEIFWPSDWRDNTHEFVQNLAPWLFIIVSFFSS